MSGEGERRSDEMKSKPGFTLKWARRRVFLGLLVEGGKK